MKNKRILFSVIAVTLLIAIGVLLINRLEASAPDPVYSPIQHPHFPDPTPTGVPQSYEPNCQQPPSRDDADLCAQWAAVEAVKQGNSLTRLSIWLTFFEFIALAFSLFFAAWAALASSRATKASEKALVLTEKSNKAQIRPYVYFDSSSVKLFEPGKTVRAQAIIHLKNFGSTPAIDMEFSFLSALETTPLQDGFFFEPLISIPPPRRMPPNHSRLRWVNLEEDQLTSILNGTHVLLIKAEVTYKTSTDDDALTDSDRVVLVFDGKNIYSGHGRAPRPYDFASGSSAPVDDFLRRIPFVEP